MFLDAEPVLKWIVNIRDYGLEYAIRRYYGLYGGEVVDIKDTKSQARASVKVGVLGVGTVRPNKSFDPATHPKRALPSSVYAGPDHGVYFPPEPGDSVWVAFNHGDSEHPHYVGSWWRNKSPDGNAEASEVPAEFKMLQSGAAPKKRGIKTQGGHGMIFSDEESAPYVAIWSGDQQTVGKSAFRKNQITLSDTEGVPNVKEMVDPSVKTGIYANTQYGHVLQLNDTDKKIVLSGLRADPNATVANALIIEDVTGKITIKTKSQQTIEVDDVTGAININNLAAAGTGLINIVSKAATNITAGGAVTLSAAGGVAIGSGAAPPAPAIPGASVETGIGAKLINFAGAITETVGSFVQNSASTIFNAPIFTVNTLLASIGPVPGFGLTILTLPFPVVIIGDISTAKQLLTADLLDWLENHTHIGNMGGATPLSPADALLLKDPGNPANPNPLYVSNSLVS